MNIQHGQKRPHPVGVLPFGILVIVALIAAAVLIFGASINWGEPRQVEHSFGHIVLPKAPHEREPLPLPVGVPVPRPVGTPVVTQ